MLESNTVILFLSILIMLGFINTLKPAINFENIYISIYKRDDIYSDKLLGKLNFLGEIDSLLFNLIIIPALYSLIIVIKLIANDVPQNGIITIENLIAIPSLINLCLFILISVTFKFESVFRDEGYFDDVVTKYLIKKDLKEDTPKDIVNIIDSLHVVDFAYRTVDTKSIEDNLKFKTNLFSNEILRINKNYKLKRNLCDYLRKPENSKKIKLLSEIVSDTKVLSLIDNSGDYRFVKAKELCTSQVNNLTLDMIAYVDNNPLKII